MGHKLFSPKYWFFDFVKVTAVLPGLLWLRPKWIYENGRAKERLRGGVLLASNHQSHLDPVYLQFAVGYRRQRFVCMKEFFETPARRWIFGHFMCIPIDRENVSMKSVREVAGALRDGWVVSIFPEGRITAGNTGVFKTGVILMAAQAECPIVPVYIRRPLRWWQRLKICIGEPIDVIALCGGKPNLRQMEEISQTLKEKEERLEALCP